MFPQPAELLHWFVFDLQIRQQKHGKAFGKVSAKQPNMQLSQRLQLTWGPNPFKYYCIWAFIPAKTFSPSTMMAF